MLAESWSFPDQTTIEFKLRQGVTFHNGEPFNAASVKFSIERLLDPVLNSPLRGGWPKTFQGVEIVDDSTVRFHFSAPEATIFDAMAQSAAMLPPTYYSSELRGLPGQPSRSAAGLHLRRVRSATTTPRSLANPNYWGTATYKGTPLVPTVIFRPVPDAATRVADLLNGTADMIFDVSPDDIRHAAQSVG